MTSTSKEALPDLSEIQQFFDNLAYRLESDEASQRQLDRRLATEFNTFEWIDPDENGLSDIIAHLLNPRGKHGQGELFLRKFLDQLGIAWRADIEHAKIQREAPTYEIENYKRRIDILVDMPGLKIGIENKVDAIDQTNQVREYIDHLANLSDNSFRLLYLTPNGRNPSSLSATQETIRRYKESGQLFCWSYERDIRHWIEICREGCEAEKIRFFLEDFINYIDNRLHRDSPEEEQQ